MLSRQDLHALSCNRGELHLVDRVTVPLVNYRKTFVEDLLALLQSLSGVPMVGDQRKAEVFREPSSHVVLDDVVAVEINAGKVGFSVFKASDNEVVVVGILVVSLLVAEFGQVVSVVFD
jgi:hypothetical protein